MLWHCNHMSTTAMPGRWPTASLGEAIHALRSNPTCTCPMFWGSTSEYSPWPSQGPQDFAILPDLRTSLNRRESNASLLQATGHYRTPLDEIEMPPTKLRSLQEFGHGISLAGSSCWTMISPASVPELTVSLIYLTHPVLIPVNIPTCANFVQKSWPWPGTANMFRAPDSEDLLLQLADGAINLFLSAMRGLDPHHGRVVPVECPRSSS